MKYFFMYLFSKTFWKNLLIMAVLSLIILGGIYFWLLRYTRHNESLTVPDFYGLKLRKAKKVARQHHLELVVIDTLDFDPDMPKFSVRYQNPLKGDKVKSGRKIYVKLNAGGFRSVQIPKLRGITPRQAKATLRAMGIRVGKVVEKPYFARVVLDVIHGKDTLRRGDKLPQQSVVTLVVGSGEEAFETDTISADSLNPVLPGEE